MPNFVLRRQYGLYMRHAGQRRGLIVRRQKNRLPKCKHAFYFPVKENLYRESVTNMDALPYRIIAIMLGRLGMTVDECIRAYKEVAQKAFTPKWSGILPGSPNGAYSAEALEAAIKQTVRAFCVDPDCAAQRSQGGSTVETCPHNDLEFRDPSCTKTYVRSPVKRMTKRGSDG